MFYRNLLAVQTFEQLRRDQTENLNMTWQGVNIKIICLQELCAQRLAH